MSKDKGTTRKKRRPSGAPFLSNYLTFGLSGVADGFGLSGIFEGFTNCP